MIRCASTRQSAASLVSRRFFGLRAPDFPSIDVRQLEATAAPDVRRAALDALRSALKQRGFFYATNVPQLPRSYIDSVYEYLARAHALPVEVKRRFVSPYGGYVGSDAGAEFAELAYAAGTTASVRAWDFSRAPFTAAASIAPSSDQKAPRRRFPNVADDGLAPDFETKMNELYDRQNQLAAVLLPAFAEMFGERADLFSRFFDAGDLGTIRLLSYPGLAPVANAATQSTGTDFGIAPHTDFEVFTLMHQNAPGLQFMLPPSEQVAAAVSAGTSAKAAPLTWLDAPVDDGNFVVIVGDVLERMTNGVLRATPHRVLRTPHSRQSIIRFCALHPDSVIEPLPEFLIQRNADGMVVQTAGAKAVPVAAKYTPVTMQKHMETTMNNVRAGLGSWDSARNVSLSATYPY